MLAYRIIFLRHGETDWNAEGRLQGQKDIPLNAKGRFQAGEAGRALARLLGPAGLNDPALNWVSSPLSRATTTLQLARVAAGMPAEGFETDPRLMELTFGEWEGLTWPDVQARSPQSANWRDGDKWNFQPPGGESYAMLGERLQPWLESLTGDTVVAAHGGVCRVLMAQTAGLACERAALVEIHQGRVVVFHKGRFDWI
jgi:broad specificity phosphatase PhoE